MGDVSFQHSHVSVLVGVGGIQQLNFSHVRECNTPVTTYSNSDFPHTRILSV